MREASDALELLFIILLLLLQIIRYHKLLTNFAERFHWGWYWWQWKQSSKVLSLHLRTTSTPEVCKSQVCKSDISCTSRSSYRAIRFSTKALLSHISVKMANVARLAIPKWCEKFSSSTALFWLLVTECGSTVKLKARELCRVAGIQSERVTNLKRRKIMTTSQFMKLKQCLVLLLH